MISDKVKYIVGVDFGYYEKGCCSKGALSIFKENYLNGEYMNTEFIKIIPFENKYKLKLLNKLLVKYNIWKLNKYYKNIKVVKEISLAERKSSQERINNKFKKQK